MYHLECQKFGRLFVIRKDTITDKKHNVYWKCRCECGKIVSVRASDLVRGHSNSCGCYHKDQAKLFLTNLRSKNKHFHNSKRKIYRIWWGMMNRCYNPSFRFYNYYGGRGIIVCKEWHDFFKFVEDMGERPENLTLDRIDPDGNYCKENCRWATMKEQNNNKRDCCFIYYNGTKYSAKMFSKEFGLNYSKTLKAYHLGLNSQKIMSFAKS